MSNKEDYRILALENQVKILIHDKLSLQADLQMAQNRILFLENELRNLNKFDNKYMTIL